MIAETLLLAALGSLLAWVLMPTMHPDIQRRLTTAIPRRTRKTSSRTWSFAPRLR